MGGDTLFKVLSFPYGYLATRLKRFSNYCGPVKSRGVAFLEGKPGPWIRRICAAAYSARAAPYSRLVSKFGKTSCRAQPPRSSPGRRSAVRPRVCECLAVMSCNVSAAGSLPGRGNSGLVVTHPEAARGCVPNLALSTRRPETVFMSEIRIITDGPGILVLDLSGA